MRLRTTPGLDAAGLSPAVSFDIAAALVAFHAGRCAEAPRTIVVLRISFFPFLREQRTREPSV